MGAKKSSLEKKELKELLIKGWMTHDAMWFMNCVGICGMEKTNQINIAAVQSMAAIEIRRIIKAFQIPEVRSMDALKELFEKAWQVVKADFMDFELSYPNTNIMRWDIHRCFAFEGVTKLGVATQYQCGICPRVEAWFAALNIKYTVTPVVQGCMMHTDNKCFREYRFDFKGS